MGLNISRSLFEDIGQQSSDERLKEESEHRYLKSPVVNVINHFSHNNGTISVTGFQNNNEFFKLGEETLNISFLNSINGDNKGNIAIGNENKLFTSDYEFSTQSRSADKVNADECEENLFQSTFDGANDSATGIGNENNVFKSDYDFQSQSGGENSNVHKGNLFRTNFYGATIGTTVIGDENNLFTSDDIDSEFTTSCHKKEPSDATVSFCKEIQSSTFRPTSQFALDKQYQNLSPYNQVPCSYDKEFQSFLKKYRGLANNLHYLRDYGFYKKLNNNIKVGLEKEDAVEKVVCLVEKSINLGHRKKLLESETILKTALQQIPESNPSVASALSALCNLELASICRRDGKLDSALMYINTAVQRMEFLPKSEVYAYVIYERGSILTLIAGRNDSEDSLKMAEDAEGDFKQIISIFVELESVIKNLYVRKHIFALCKLAIRKLRCETTADRNSPITDAAIREAWNCIQRVTTKYSDQIPPAAKIQLRIAQSDYNYRVGKYEEAKMFATCAMVKANELSMKLEPSRIESRLEAITACLQKEVVHPLESD